MSSDPFGNNISLDELFDFDNELLTSKDFITDDWSLANGTVQGHEERPSLSPQDHQYQYQQQASATSLSSAEPTLVCGVCGAPAHGYNFDQITCESCKAFFRRNALKNMSQLRCRSNGRCVINVQNRRQCAYCRLKKCFDIKMRKDWIRTEEERQMRRLQNSIKEQKKLSKQIQQQKTDGSY